MSTDVTGCLWLNATPAAKLLGRYAGPAPERTREIALKLVAELVSDFRDLCVGLLEQITRHLRARPLNNSAVGLVFGSQLSMQGRQSR